MRRHGISAVASTDADYPALLRECPDYPHVALFRRRRRDFPRQDAARWSVPVRRPFTVSRCAMLGGPRGRTRRRNGGRQRLAYGIDAAAHRAALRYGLRTVAVIANPLPALPPQHRALAHDIAEQGGAVVTELHSRTRAERRLFHTAQPDNRRDG